jgi:hypothetical protein
MLKRLYTSGLLLWLLLVPFLYQKAYNKRAF